MGKKSSPPPPPDYTQLALQQAALSKESTDDQTVANRPNQYTPYGQTEWFQGDDGSWIQSVALNPEDQALLDNSRILQGGQQEVAYDLMGNVGNTLRTPLSLEGLPEIEGFDQSQLINFANPNDITQGAGAAGSIDLSQLPELGDAGFGAVQEVTDAMMGRLAPARSQARESEVARLKNQGLSESSEAFRRAMTRLDQGDTDAQQQALLKGMDAYGDIYNRQLAGRQQGLTEQGTVAQLSNQNRANQIDTNARTQAMIAALRGQQVGEQQARANFTGTQRQQALAEQQMIRDQPLNDYLKLVAGTSPGQVQMPSFMQSGAYQAPDLLGAGNMQYQAGLGATNAKNAQQAGLTSGLLTVAGGIFGGPMGAAAGAALGGMGQGG